MGKGGGGGRRGGGGGGRLAYGSKVFQKAGREMTVPRILSCFPGFDVF